MCSKQTRLLTKLNHLSVLDWLEPGRKLEAQARSFGPFLAHRSFVFGLLVTVGHRLARTLRLPTRVPHAEPIDSWRGRSVVAQVRVAKTPERMSAALRLPQLF